MKKKKLLIAFLVVVLCYVLWLGFQLLHFECYSQNQTDKNRLEIKGAYHIHTLFSDGKKNPHEIAKMASRASLDFIILSDHGEPNYESMNAAGWKENVLVLSGSELSVSRGHLVALGFKTPTVPFSKNAEQAVYQIKTQDGFSVIAHPYSKVSWSWGEFIDYTGIEIINANTMFTTETLQLIPYFPFFLIKPDIVFIKMLCRPERNLRKWDELNRIHPIFGFFSIDAHLFYKSLLPLLNLHVLLKTPLSGQFEEASQQVYESLKEGRFYNAVDAAAQADGFRFWMEKGNQRLEMGEETDLDSQIMGHVHAAFPFATEILLLHNGKLIHSSTQDDVTYKITKPGFYRVEVYLKERSPLHRDIPWIVSNPIFLTEKHP